MAGPRQRIVVGMDGSDGARAALSWAFTEAAGRGADLEVLAAYPVDFYWTDPYLIDRARIDDIRADTRARAQALVDEVRAAPAVAAVAGVADVGAEVVVVAGPAAAHLVERSTDAELLVVGNRGRGGLRSTVAGSVALHCSAHARCPVVVVHPTAEPAAEPARVVVGLDPSDQGRSALVTAAQQAGRLGARIDAVVAYESENYWSDLYAVLAPPLGETREHALHRAGDMVKEELGPGPVEFGAVVPRAVEGHAGEVLVQEARGARLLVVGSRSRNQLSGVVLGSVALHCVMHAPCPVLVVRPEPAEHRIARARALAATSSSAG